MSILKSKIVTFISDFGLQDAYVGVMKGVIAQINPQIQIIDLTHHIPPQNIAAGSFSLLNAYPYFPVGTIHVAIVDPGVGSQRRGVAVAFPGGYLVAPDNGLLSGILSIATASAAVELTNSRYWHSPNPSSTFHGRDIFAPVAAHLASGVSLTELGVSIDPASLTVLPLTKYEATNNGFLGRIQYIDHFGNLITNIPQQLVEGKIWSVVAAQIKIPNHSTYSNVAVGELVALIGSHGWVEIAVNGGNAQSRLGLEWGDSVSILTPNQDLS